MTYNGTTLRNRPHVFRSGSLAVSSAVKGQRVVMGEAGEYLVVTNADAMRLHRAGYEVVA